ncbi:SWPV2-ORF210 [Shearwaterpox virus]|uniref:SWPV2-ORF210 n=1 Tax=Shearwaterpox virus TaxID=1974596 RepID=A0A1V0QGG3_CNPV|nr:SWPV2-ORF210 [Shearwaterpox virus]QRM15857.1 n1r/p28-like protein [Penguinpox virus 2]
MDFSNLVTHEINERFCYIKYDTFDLIMMKKNGFINATKLCKLGGRNLKHWLENKQSKELVKELENIYEVWKIKSLGQNSGKMILEVNAESEKEHQYDVSGYYIHQDLLPHICSWISPLFAIRVYKIINCYVSGKYEFKLKHSDNTNKELLELIKEFNRKYDKDTLESKERYKELDNYSKRMEEKYDRDIAETRERYREQRKEAKELKEHNKKLSNSVKRMEMKYNKDTNKLKSELKEVKIELKKLEERLKDKVNTSFPNNVHRLVISQNDKDPNILKLYDYKPEV